MASGCARAPGARTVPRTHVRGLRLAYTHTHTHTPSAPCQLSAMLFKWTEMLIQDSELQKLRAIRGDMLDAGLFSGAFYVG